MSRWDDLAALEESWDGLWRAGLADWPEFYPLAWARAGAMARQPDGSPWCVIGYASDRVAGIAPLYTQVVRVTRLRLALRGVTFMPHPFLYRRAFLCPAAVDGELLAQLLEQLRRKRDWDLLALTGLPPVVVERWRVGGVLAGTRHSLLQLNSAHGGLPGSAAPDLCVTRLPSSWDEYLATRRRSFRKRFERQQRVAREQGRLEFRRHLAGRGTAGAPLTLEECVRHIREIESASWQSARGVHLGRYGYGTLEELLSIPYRAGALDVAVLFLDGSPVAYNLGIVAGQTLRACATAYKPAYARLSPGFLLRAELVRNTIECRDIRCIDLGGSSHEFKRDFADVCDSAFELSVYNGTSRGRLLYAYRRRFGRYHEFPGEG